MIARLDARRRRKVAVAAAAIALLLLAAAGAGAATITVVNNDGIGEGFNDLTPVLPVAGNAGTTIGQQRLNAFQAAAAYWANRLGSSVQILVEAEMSPLACNASSAVLAQAGPKGVARDFPGAPLSATWYPYALASSLAAFDVDPTAADLGTGFNSSIGLAGCLDGIVWSYAVGAPAPLGSVSFFETVRHELAHGLGFITAVQHSTGARLLGFDDVYMTFLEDHSTGKTWPQMSNGERFSSARDPGDLHWTGAQVLAASTALAAGRHPSAHVQMYAPNPLQSGSSVSHWDTVLVPNEMMEPVATANPADVVSTALMRDLGWAAPLAGGCIRDADTACLLGNRFEVEAGFQSSVGSGPAQVMSFNGQRAENEETAFFTFFSGTNFEMGVKVLNACAFGKYWVFVSGLTDVGWSVRVRDTQSAAPAKLYTNPIGTLSTTFADTSAFNCP